MANKNPSESTRFTSENQPSPESKSRGQVQRAKNMNILATARTLFESANILPGLIDNIQEEVQNGFNKNAIELLKIIKEPEKQKIELEGQIQKIYITHEQQKKAMEHIAKTIND